MFTRIGLCYSSHHVIRKHSSKLLLKSVSEAQQKLQHKSQSASSCCQEISHHLSIYSKLNNFSKVNIVSKLTLKVSTYFKIKYVFFTPKLCHFYGFYPIFNIFIDDHVEPPFLSFRTQVDNPIEFGHTFDYIRSTKTTIFHFWSKSQFFVCPSPPKEPEILIIFDLLFTAVFYGRKVAMLRQTFSSDWCT